MTEHEVVEALRTRYKAPEYVLLPQVRNGTGYARTARTADAIAMSVWPSRGLTLSGFEVKAYRGDWLAELRNPAKSGEIQQFCDEWWIVTPRLEPRIVQAGELPHTWGLIEIHNGKPTTMSAAPQLESVPITKLFLASVMRGIMEYEAPFDLIEQAKKKSFKEGRESERKNSADVVKRLTEKMEQLEANIKTFRHHTGIEMNWENPERIGKAYRLFLDKGEAEKMRTRLEDVKFEAERIAMETENSLQALGRKP